jgi:glutaminyl-tRNA synthetase
MAPKAKFDPNDPTILTTISLFTSIGLAHTKATETVRNARNSTLLKELIDRNELATLGLEEKQGNLILHLAVQGSKLELDEQDYVGKAVVESRLKTNDQVTGMLSTFVLKPATIPPHYVSFNQVF